MIKCIHETCQWPNCNKTCGMVPEGDYEAGSCHEENLIRYLQDELAQLAIEAEAARIFVNRVKTDANRALEHIPKWQEYERVCPYGYVDCVFDPGYMRKYHPEEWIKMGMPTTCGESCGGKDGGYCNSYDWEDK